MFSSKQIKISANVCWFFRIILDLKTYLFSHYQTHKDMHYKHEKHSNINVTDGM